ncbi:MAG TPA: PQQ-dependent sugar dehydrogenase [Chitinophagaceae bacterium]|nr:PQQ-dependent sugar dehydrogenase [Chitinophagaceae bacterium]
MRKIAVLIIIRLLIFFPGGLFQSINAQPSISYDPKITGLTAPVDIVDAKDGSGRLFIVQQNGIIRVWNGTSLLPTPFLDVSSLIVYTGDERGLLSMVFHPAYTTNGYFFIYYNTFNSGTNITSINVARYHVSADPNVAGSTGTIFITIPKPAGRTNHNGGDLNFGSDGYLYFGTGDGGGGNDPDNLAQNGNSLLGKMLRIDINTPSMTYGNYSVPPDNPYIADAGVDDRIWALGLRNPFRWSFDRLTGDMWIGDVGQGAKEEVNYRPAGSTGHVNYGWRCYEGTISTPGVPDCTPADNVFPVFDYDNPGDAAVTGGFVYRGTEAGYAGFRGYYISADVYSGTVYLTRPNGAGWLTTSQSGLQTFIVSFGEAQNGDLYAVSLTTGTVYKVVASGGVPLPVTLTDISVKKFTGYNQLQWTTSFEQSTARFIIEYSTDNRNYSRVGQVAASRNTNGSNYNFRHEILTNHDVFYRLAIEDDDGKINYSPVVKIFGTEDRTKISPTVIKDGVINLILNSPADKLQLVNSNGSKVFEKNLKNILGTSALTLPSLARGVYWVQIISNNKVEQHKIVIQ